MKKTIYLFILLLGLPVFSQVPAYYSGIDFTRPNRSIHNQLTHLISSTHNQITYSQCFGALKESDGVSLNPIESGTYNLSFIFKEKVVQHKIVIQ